MSRHIVISLLLIIVLTVYPSPGQPLNDSNNKTALQAASVVAFLNESEPCSATNLSCIWSVKGIESGQVIMVLNQNKSDLYGQAKYEPDNGLAWNGIVIGSIEEDRIDLVMTVLKNAVQFTSRMKGTYDVASGLIRGSILQVSKGRVSLRSDFEAMSINPDISSYTSAREAPPARASVLGQETNASLSEAKDSLLPASSQKSRYHDVREDADRILTGVGDISQIPIGMSGL